MPQFFASNGRISVWKMSQFAIRLNLWHSLDYTAKQFNSILSSGRWILNEFSSFFLDSGDVGRNISDNCERIAFVITSGYLY
jgi:hypothetical protein